MTIHNGIDPEAFRRQRSRQQARAMLDLPPTGRLILGAVGRLDSAKGFSFLIEAVARLRSEYPHLLLVLAGQGPLRARLQEEVNALGLADHIRFLGFCSDVNLVYDALDVFVIPSLSETLGYALLEAMAHELPAVGSSVGGIPEVILPMETGLLVPPRDSVVLGEAIKLLLESADLRERMGRAGRARVICYFHESDMVRKTIAVYRGMLRCN
jgi:glycosyltransferase involved in cell wall biosynthesis